MREGFYRVDYQGAAGFGCAVLALDSGMVVGADTAGGTYDGEYIWNEQTQQFDLQVTVSIPEGAPIVQGKIAPKGGFEFGAQCSFPREPQNRLIQVATEHGPVSATIHLLKSFT